MRVFTHRVNGWGNDSCAYCQVIEQHYSQNYLQVGKTLPSSTQHTLLATAVDANSVHTSNCVSKPVLFVLGFIFANSDTFSLASFTGAAIEVSPHIMASRIAS